MFLAVKHSGYLSYHVLVLSFPTFYHLPITSCVSDLLPFFFIFVSPLFYLFLPFFPWACLCFIFVLPLLYLFVFFDLPFCRPCFTFNLPFFQNHVSQEILAITSLNPTWDEKWLPLVQHYFALLQWPSVDQVSPVSISLVEIMLDFCLTFQVRVPVDLRTTQLKGPGVPILPPKSPAKYFLPNRQMGAVLPPECLKQTSHTSLRTFDYLQKMLAMAPVDRENLRSLAPIGYSNVLPSLRISLVLLSGLQARSLLTRILVPGVRVLKYSYRIPVVPPRDMPFLPSDF